MKKELRNRFILCLALCVFLMIPISPLYAQNNNDSIPNDSIPNDSTPVSVTRSSNYIWLTLPYQIRERIDFVTNQVYYEIWQDSIFLGIEKVIPLTDYFAVSAYKNIISRSRETGQRRQTQGEQPFDRMGLIPDVELPKIPLFGEGSRINISGSDKITFGGRQTFTKGFTETTNRPRLLPELKMDQALKVNLEGTIGERTKVLIDHDSERELAGRNKVKLSYTGTEDDILQDLEFGDTRLVIPGTGYTGDLPATKGLFGASGKAKLGGLDVYAIASREESQGETKEFRGQTRVVYDTIFDTEFLNRTFYYIGITDAINPVTDLKVYMSDNPNNPNGEPAIATVFPNFPESIPHYSYDRDIGKYLLKVRGEDYIFHENGNAIEFINNAPLPSNYAVAVSYILGNDTVGGSRILPGDTTRTLVLKLIVPRRADTSSLCWNYELKNIYYLGAKEIKIDEIKILRDDPGTENDLDYETDNSRPTAGQTYITILGLDPDNNQRVEWPEFDATRGYIIFPNPFPFADTILSVRDSIIYWSTSLASGEGRKYKIAVSYSTAKGSFNLGQIDIEEGSEKVYINGQLQTKDDYEINYLTGELSFKKPLPQNADVKVTYEYRPLFSMSQKSLLGTRGEWKLSENGKIGSSLFYRQEALGSEPRATLGSEPFQRLIAETDASYSYSPEFITNVLQKVPFFRADAPASFSFSSEGAISLPNPNTRGITYIDDFEKTTLTQDVIMRGLFWQFSSVPSQKDTSNFTSERLFWYNPTQQIRKDSIFGTGLGEEGDQTVEYLRVFYTPNDTSSWAGLMTCISQSGYNLREIENLEVVLRTSPRLRQYGKINFTIATRIDEDAPRRTKNGQIAGYNNFLDNEDRDNNGILDENIEDTGLDTVFAPDQANTAEDDGNDDYDKITNPIGTEKNKKWDTEDLDHAGFSRNNDYYEYTVSLNDSALFTPLVNDWKLLRIPLTDSSILRDPNKFRTEGVPKWDDIRIVRVWFSGYETKDTFDVYSVTFAGSRWRNARVVRLDTISSPAIDSSEQVKVASLSQTTDPNYLPPFELRKDPTTGQTEYEASLAMTYDSIKTGHIGIATKTTFEKEDYRDYEKIRIYVHNDVNDPNFIFRFGSDSTRYYEFKAPISSGSAVAGRSGWYEFDIILDTAVYIKSLKGDRVDTTIGNYRVFGTPSIEDIRYQVLGIENRSQTIISGNVWFDDIRLLNPRAEPGYGFQSNASFTLSDLATASFSLVYSDPNFRRFSEGRGVKTGGFGTTYSYVIRGALDRILPTLGFSIPVSYRRSTSSTLPKFSSRYSDLRLSRTDAEKEKGASTDEQLSLNNISKAKSRNPILNYTVEALSFSLGQRKANSISALDFDTSYSRFGSVDYSINPDLSLTLFDTDISLFPNSIRAGLDVTDSRAARYTRRGLDSLWRHIRTDTLRAADASVDVEYSPLDNFDLSYSYGSSRDLLQQSPDKLFGIKTGLETDNEENFNANYEIELFDILKPGITFDSRYAEINSKLLNVPNKNFENNSNIDVTTELSLPTIFEKISDISNGSNISKAFNGLSGMFQSIDLSYSQEQNANFQSATARPPILYRLGFARFDSTRFSARAITRQNSEDISASSGANLKNLNLNFRYGRGINKNIFTYDVNADNFITWPDVSLSLGRLEKLLFGLASNSELSTGYKFEQRQSGTMSADSFRLEGQRQSTSKNFSPLASWSTTWKGRLTTNISTNYSESKEEVFLSNGSTSTQTKQTGANLAFSYTFSAPNGIPVPFLRRMKLSSDLNLTWNLRYNKSFSQNVGYDGRASTSRNDKNLGTDVAASYRLSNSVESGLTTGYTLYSDMQRARETNSVDLNFWVLFKF